MEIARIIPVGQERPGDIWFEAGSGWAAKFIKFSQWSSVNHAFILIRPLDDGAWLIAEANDKGFRLVGKELPAGWCVRMPGTYSLEIVDAARHLAMQGTKYDWLAIAFHAFRWFDRFRVARWFAGKAKSLIRPRAARLDKVICSEAVLLCLRDVEAGWDIVDQFDGLTFEVSPADLFRGLCGWRA